MSACGGVGLKMIAKNERDTMKKFDVITIQVDKEGDYIVQAADSNKLDNGSMFCISKDSKILRDVFGFIEVCEVCENQRIRENALIAKK